MKTRIALLAWVYLVCGAAVGWLDQPARAQPDTSIQRIISLVSDTAIRSTIASMEAFGTRRFDQPNKDSVFQWVFDRFASTGVGQVEFDTFSYNGIPQKNVIATIPGTATPDKVIVVAGHLDSNNSGKHTEAPGADDNASGTAAAVEMARVITASGYKPSMTFRFIAFAAEEAGLRGSLHYAQSAAAAGMGIQVMMNYDMIGRLDHTQGDRDFNVIWYSGSEAYSDLYGRTATTYTTLQPLFTIDHANQSDSYAFYLSGYHAVFLAETDFNPYIHTQYDRLDSLDMPYAKEIVQAGLATLLAVDKGFPVSSAGGEKAGMPHAFALAQNYPNPFNPTTAIAYSLPEYGRVRLEVFDLLGRSIAVLVDANEPAGSRSVRWDAGALPGGVYIMRLSAPAGQIVRTMVLVR
jgi:hypothetical protein